MAIQRKRLYFIHAVLIITMGISWNLYFKTIVARDTLNIAGFPKEIGAWTSEELPIPPEDLNMLETRNAFVRRYTNKESGAIVYLFLVYSQHNRKVAHPPEICYIGSGISIIENVFDPIDVGYKNLTIPSNRLKLIRGDLKHISFYWFKIGNKMTSSYWKQQLLIAFNAIRGAWEGSALIRVSADIVGEDQQKAIDDVKSFVQVVTPALYEYLQ